MDADGLLTPLVASREGSELLLARLADRLVLVLSDQDARALTLIDPDSKATVYSQRLDCAPGKMVLASSGELAVVMPSCNELRTFRFEARENDAPLLDAANGVFKEIHGSVTSVEPLGLALHGGEITVVSGWGRALQTFSLPNLTAKAPVVLPREPRAVSLSEDGTRAFVAHAVDGLLSDVELSSQRVEQHSLSAVRRVTVRHHRRRIPIHDHDFEPLLVNSLNAPRAQHATMSVRTAQLFGGQGFASIAMKDRVFVPQTLSNPGGAQDIPSGYGTSRDNFPANMQDVAVYDGTSRTSNREASQFAIIAGWSAHRKNVCRLPRAAVYDPARESLLVACLDSDRVLEFDALARDPARTELAQWRTPRGPSALAIDASARKAFVWSRFAREITELSLAAGAPQRPNEHSDAALARRQADTPDLASHRVVNVPLLGDEAAEASRYLRGEALFHSAEAGRISKDGRACASCHPDGREDGLSWRTEGQLMRRQTMMLAGRVSDTAPYGWQGENPTLEAHVEHTITAQLQGKGLPQPDLDALVHFVATMPGPVIPAQQLTAEQARGQALFHQDSVGCAECHHADGGVDGKQHALNDAVKRDTPSLRNLIGTAPFFHDGRYRDLNTMLIHTQGTMGQAETLSEQDRNDLVAYLRTL
jgi:mono/diheme cytochrome c family protein